MYIHNDSEFVEVLSKRGIHYDQMQFAIKALKKGLTVYGENGYEFYKED